MNRSPSSSGMLPLPGSPGSSWAMYKQRLKAVFAGADTSVLVAFWLFGRPQTSSPSSLSPLLTYLRPNQQRPLRYNTIRCPRSRRSQRAQSRRPISRCPPLLHHQVDSALLHPPRPIHAPNPHILRPLLIRHAPYCPHTHNPIWRINLYKTHRRYNGFIE